MIENIGGILNSVSIIALSVAVARNTLGIKRLSDAMVGKQVLARKKEKKREAVVAQLKAPEGTTRLGPVFAAHPPALHITAEYEDNEIFCQELRISLSPSDWCKFEKQEFYSQLIEWVRHLENSETLCNTGDPQREKD